MEDFSIPVGIVIERREIDNPWQDFSYKPIAIIPHAQKPEGWQKMQTGQGWVHFHACTLTLELHKGETEGYRYNLSQPVSSVYIVLRPGEERDDNDVEPFHVTVCPYEAMKYAESGDEIVEAVLMPEDILAWVKTFVDDFHVDEPFKKRKNKKHMDRDAQGPRGGVR